MSKSIILVLSGRPSDPSPECHCELCEATRKGFAALTEGKQVYANTWRATVFGDVAAPSLRYMFARWDSPMPTLHDLGRLRHWLKGHLIDDDHTPVDVMRRVGFELAEPVWLNRDQWRPLAKVGTVGNHPELGPVVTLSLEAFERFKLDGGWGAV